MALKKPELNPIISPMVVNIFEPFLENKEKIMVKNSKVVFFYQTKRLHAKVLLIWTSTIGDKCLHLLLVFNNHTFLSSLM